MSYTGPILPPCPFCGSNELSENVQDDITCDDCGGQGSKSRWAQMRCSLMPTLHVFVEERTRDGKELVFNMNAYLTPTLERGVVLTQELPMPHAAMRDGRQLRITIKEKPHA